MIKWSLRIRANLFLKYVEYWQIMPGNMACFDCAVSFNYKQDSKDTKKWQMIWIICYFFTKNKEMYKKYDKMYKIYLTRAQKVHKIEIV